jgi:SAM-dependent methyltransferase
MNIKQRIYLATVKTGMEILTKVFPEYFAKEPLKPTDRYIEYPFVIRNLPGVPAKVLDVGCAGSLFPLLLASFGYATSAIDIREYSIVKYLQYNNFNFFQEDITKAHFPDAYFDVVTSISTVEHIGLSGRYGSVEDLDADKKAVSAMIRVVKPGGVILLTVPFGVAKIDKPHCRIYDSKWIKELTQGLVI